MSSFNTASIEVASNGYIVTILSDGFPTTKSVYTNVVEALEAVARHICYEQVTISTASAQGKNEVQK